MFFFNYIKIIFFFNFKNLFLTLKHHNDKKTLITNNLKQDKKNHIFLSDAQP